jgi:hypothetical protein
MIMEVRIMIMEVRIIGYIIIDVRDHPDDLRKDPG